MLDRECYEQVLATMTDLFDNDEVGANTKELAQKTLSLVEPIIKKHKYATYWGEFEEAIVDRHFADAEIMKGVIGAYKGLFYAFESYVNAQLKKEEIER